MSGVEKEYIGGIFGEGGWVGWGLKLDYFLWMLKHFHMILFSSTACK